MSSGITKMFISQRLVIPFQQMTHQLYLSYVSSMIRINVEYIAKYVAKNNKKSPVF